MMQALGRRYVYYVNRRYKRSGTLWEGRVRRVTANLNFYWK
jgi:putative transposase